MLQHHRHDEHTYSGVQSDRFQLLHDQWFFTTREHVLKGPYLTMESSEKALDAYILLKECELALSKNAHKRQ